jgi:hypothetical protein
VLLASGKGWLGDGWLGFYQEEKREGNLAHLTDSRIKIMTTPNSAADRTLVYASTATAKSMAYTGADASTGAVRNFV